MSTDESTPTSPPSLREIPMLASTWPNEAHQAYMPPPAPGTSTSLPVPPSPPNMTAATNERGRLAAAAADSTFWGEVDAIRARVSAAMVADEAAMSASEEAQREIGRSYVESQLQEQQAALMREGHARWDPEHQDRLKRSVMAALFGLGRLQPLVEIETVENIEITGYDRVLLMHSDGRREWGPAVAESDAQLIEYLQFLASRRGASGERAFTRANPTLSLSMAPDLRLQAAAFITPRPKVVIRKDRLASIDLDGLRQLGELDETLFDFLTAAVRARKSIVVSGRGQGSGKSTLLRALIGQMDPWESIVTVETEYELRLDKLPDRHHRTTPFEARPGSGEVGADGKAAGEFTINQAVYTSLRLNADRVVVGEVRGHEVIPMFKAMQMGNGSFSTIHANNARDVVERLVTCAVEDSSVTEAYAYRQVFQHIDLVVFLDSTYEPGTRHRHRFIREVIEITSPDQAGAVPYAVNQIFTPGPDGRAVPTGTNPSYIGDLVEHGFDPAQLSNPEGTWPPLQRRAS